MTDATGPLRERLWATLADHVIGYDRRSQPFYACGCGWDGRVDRGENDTLDGALAHVATMLLPVVRQAQAEAWIEGHEAGSEDETNAYWSPMLPSSTPNPYCDNEGAASPENQPAIGAPKGWALGYLPCGCRNDGRGGHVVQ